MDDQTRNDLPENLSNPARRALLAAGYRWLEQFTRVSETELLQLHGVGPKTIRQLTEALRLNNLAFAAPRTK